MADFKNQHFVPQTYLRFFINYDYIPENYSKDALWTINTHTKKIKMKGIENICSENYYYSYKSNNSEYNHEIEHFLSGYENNFKDVLSKVTDIRQAVLNGCILKKIRRSEKEFIINYILIQYFRVPKFTNRYSSLIIDGFKEINRKEKIKQSDDEIKNDLKKYSFNSLFDTSDQSFIKLKSIIDNKKMIISIIPEIKDCEFITSDSPVLITNSLGPNALISINTEIKLSLTPKIAISFYGPKGNDEYKIVNSLEQINTFNKSLFKNSFLYCFSGNKSILEKL
jgi:hypothetical protein